jgi:hypothetical protein
VTPGVYYEAVDAAPPRSPALRTDVAGFVGVATMGPVGSPVRLGSWRQFESAFGGIHPHAFLGTAVKAFFENGGRDCHVVRVAAPATATVAETGLVQPVDGRSSLVVPQAGLAPGAVVTVTREDAPLELSRVVATADEAEGRLWWDAPLDAAVWLDAPLAVERVDGTAATLSSDVAVQPSDRASTLVRSVAGFTPGTAVRVRQPERRRVRNHRIAAVDAGGGRLVWESPLPPELVSGVLGFAAGRAAAGAVFPNLAGEPALQVAAATPGAWGNALVVRTGSQAAGGTRTAAEPQPRDGGSSIVVDVSGFRRGDLVRAHQAGARPADAYLVVAAVEPGERRLVWNYDDPAGRLAGGAVPGAFDPRAPITFDRVEFTVTVERDGGLLELHRGLSLVPEHPRYAPDALRAAGSPVIELVDVLAGVPVSAGQLAIAPAARVLAGGRDGLAALTPDDVIGAPDDGVASLEQVDEVAIVAVPDANLAPAAEPSFATERAPEPDPCLPCAMPEARAPLPPPEPVERPPAFDAEDAFRIQAAVVEQCERLRDRFAVLDAPAPGPQPLEDGVAQARSWRMRFDTEFAALYFPWLHLPDPGVTRPVPPCGHVAGLYARLDIAEGVHRAPANGELRWVDDVTLDVDDALQGVLDPESVNAIRAFPGRGIRVFGARTLSSDPTWRHVSVRRLLSMIEESVEEGCQWAAFEPNDDELRALLRIGIGGLLEAVWRSGGLVGATAGEAFFVKCDGANNPPALVDQGRLVVDVGVAPAAPAEFVVFRVGRVDEQLELTEIGVAGLLANVAEAA